MISDPCPAADMAETGGREADSRGKRAKFPPRDATSSKHNVPSPSNVITTVDDPSGNTPHLGRNLLNLPSGFMFSSRCWNNLASSCASPCPACCQLAGGGLRLDYARVCVELDASLPLVTKFDIKTDLFKEPLHLEVEYEWQPPRCGKCHLFGHVCSEDKGNTVTKPAENGNLVPALDGRNLHERDERQPPRQPSLGQKPQDNKQPQKTHTKITQDSNSTSLSQTIVHHKKGRIEEDSTMEHKNQETTPTSKEDEERVRKGKMQVEVFPIGTVNESASLQSKETYVEEEVSEATATNGGNTEDGDWSPFIKLELDKWNVISNASETKAARIIIGWDHEIYNVQCIHSNLQWMTCSVTSIQPGLDIVVTFVYGANTPAERQDVWNYLQVQYRGFQRQPWVLMGDFNATLRASDSEGGDRSWNGHKLSFGECLQQAELIPVPYRGLNLPNSDTVAQLPRPNSRDSENLVERLRFSKFDRLQGQQNLE
ncbi:hypothetical protein DKX38_007099 [Salix brachista]|uniref:Endonuclease/exonuclease/phosphatase domain-containing protein n=1 Tax=Salix brachista TaxID=2182728 RepID=A0A5N5MLZ4_9ROSI|nr:hypothetical protein DKX38_007099 [Salix brachista]